MRDAPHFHFNAPSRGRGSYGPVDVRRASSGAIDCLWVHPLIDYPDAENEGSTRDGAATSHH